MTDDSATLRAMMLAAAGDVDDYAAILEHSMSARRQLKEMLIAGANALSSQSSWAKEKAELERQLADADALLFDEIYENMDEETHEAHLAEAVARHKARHASRPVTVKE